MIWERKEKDHYRWRKRFALFPKRIGERKVWLEVYAYRFLKAEDRPPSECLIIFPSDRDYVISEEFILKDGYQVRLHTFISIVIGLRPWQKTRWEEPQPQLKIVS